jgi:hypothetical protein
MCNAISPLLVFVGITEVNKLVSAIKRAKCKEGKELIREAVHKNFFTPSLSNSTVGHLDKVGHPPRLIFS